MRLSFVLIAEGPSDRGLVPHIEKLCVKAGANGARGYAPPPSDLCVGGSTVRHKLRAAVKLELGASLYFIHRDADKLDHKPRHKEIAEAVGAQEPPVLCVAVVPVQETEAWLLLDEIAIRRVAGNPNGKAHLNLPKPSKVEQLPDPKGALRQALIAASELTGRRLDRFKNEFDTHRRALLEELQIGGRLEQVHSWTRLRDAIRDAIESLHE